MRDIFVENVKKTSSRPTSAAGSRRDSISSLNQVDVPIANSFQRGVPKDGKADVGARNSFRTPRKSTSSLGRTESYRQARGDFRIDNEENIDDEYENATKNLGNRAGKDRNKKYNSLPRLSSKRRDDRNQNMANQTRSPNNDVEYRASGPSRGAHHSRPNSRSGPPKPDEQCVVM